MELQELKKQCLKNINTHSDIVSDFYQIASYVLDIAASDLIPFVEVDDKRAKKIVSMMDKHLKGYPVQKLIGYSCFYDCYIPYSIHTLTPRIETELLVEKVISDIGNKQCKVLDLCCGSGCIGIAVAKNTNAQVVCADISKYALKETKANAKLNNAKIEVVKSDMFSNIRERFDIIISNPPYIPNNEYEKLENIVKKFDPKISLVAEDEGFYFYKIIADNIQDYLSNNGRLYLEIGYNQGQRVKDLLKDKFENVEIIKDYSGNDRIIYANKLKSKE